MAVASRQSRRFPASSPVTCYWIANSVGFSLSGGGRGEVVRVLAEHDSLEPSVLEVQIGRRRQRRIPTSAVVAVVPSERLLVVSRGSAHEPRPLRVASVRLRWGLRLLLRRSGPALRSFVRFALPRLEAAAVLLLRLAVRGGVEAVRLVRSVPWQRYGRSVRSATTRLLQARSMPSSLRRTTSSGRSSANGSTDEARTTSST